MLLIASDHGGFELKQKLVAHLQARGVALRDLGVTVSALDQVPDVYRSSLDIVSQYHPHSQGKD